MYKSRKFLKVFLGYILSFLFFQSFGFGNALGETATRPKVSIIVPVYNAEKYIDECAQSLINQTLEDIEIIFIDDGSNDKSGGIVDEYAELDSRVKVIHQKNAGSALARQTGLDIATGEYIKFVDSDDKIDLKTCEICYAAIRKDDADILVHGGFSFNEDKIWVYKKFSDRLITHQNFELIVRSACLTMYRTDFLRENNVNFFGMQDMGEDQCFNMMCYPLARKIKMIPDMLYYYRQNPSSMCHTWNKNRQISESLNNICVVHNDWAKRDYFEIKAAKIGFLNGVMNLHYWPNDNEVNKLFYETLNELDSNFVNDKNIIKLLNKRSKAKFEKVIKSVKQIQIKKSKAERKNILNKKSKRSKQAKQVKRRKMHRRGSKRS